MPGPVFTHNIPRNVDDSVDLDRVDTSDVIQNEVIEALQAHAHRRGNVRVEDICTRALEGDSAALRGVCWELDDMQEEARRYE